MSPEEISFKIKRANTDPPEFIPRLTTGQEVLDIVSGAHAFSFDNDELKSESDVALVGGFLQVAQDWGDIGPELGSGSKVETSFHLTEILKELEHAGFYVFGTRERNRPLRNGKKIDWHVATLKVMHKGNPEIIEVSLEKMKTITEVTRRGIIDCLIAGTHPWAGRLTESEFLSRLYDLSALPSTDHRYENSSMDISQHRDNFRDWSDDWVFYDTRFNILRASNEQFLGFLCETVHPIVRPNSDEALELVGIYNEHLRKDGYEITKKSEISGKPVFSASEKEKRTVIFEEPTGWPKVDRQLGQVSFALKEATVEEQYQSVGLYCREVLTTLAQTVYDPNKHSLGESERPSATDAPRMLEAFISTELAGKANEEQRKHAKAAHQLANALQHKRTADYKMAALCAEATTSVVNIVAIISNRRG